MQQKGLSKDLRQMVYPYVFVLKEGDLTKNLFNYELLMLQITCPEVIKSPSYSQSEKPHHLLQELEVLKTSLAEALFQKSYGSN
jgi:hypothetical protein